MSSLPEAIDSGAGMIELRLDLIKESPAALFPLIPKNVLTIVTCRPGVFSDSERLELLIEGMKLGADYVDIELETPTAELELLQEGAKEAGCYLILSYHNFKRTPDREDMESLMISCYEKGAEIAKIATHVNDSIDIRNLLGLYELPGKKVILGMGQDGRITRVMGPYLGAEFTFASTGKAGETAPGQITVKQLSEIYKVIDES